MFGQQHAANTQQRSFCRLVQLVCGNEQASTCHKVYNTPQANQHYMHQQHLTPPTAPKHC
jgi:hypothetical protein